MKTLQSEQCGEIKIMLPFQGVGREGGDGTQGAPLGCFRLALWAGIGVGLSEKGDRQVAPYGVIGV